MGRLSKFESKMDKAFENAAGSMFKSPISPVQMTKRAEKEMHREKLVSAGVQHAPTLYNILVNPEDDEKLSGYYPTLAGEMETYLKGKADESDLHMDGHPLVRFIVDDKLKSGKFDVIAESVSASIVQQLREEEMERYGITDYNPQARQSAQPYNQAPAPSPQQPYRRPQANARQQRPYPNQDGYDDYYPETDAFEHGADEEAQDDAYFAAQERPDDGYGSQQPEYQQPQPRRQAPAAAPMPQRSTDRKSTRLNSSH